MQTPIVVSVAPNGARKTKDDHPNIPLNPEEIAKEAVNCHEAGARLIHLHIRKDDQTHSLSVNKYKSAIKEIRSELGNDIIIQVTTEACGIFSPEEQISMVHSLKPEAVSIALRELVPNEEDEPRAKDFFYWMLENKVYPQYILYNEEEVSRFAKLKSTGVIPGERHAVLFVLGRYTVGQVSTPQDLIPFLSALHKEGLSGSTNWSVCAFGKKEHACMLTAAFMGGNPRIGFENNMHLANGKIAQNNAELISQFSKDAKLTGRSIANIDQAKKIMFGL